MQPVEKQDNSSVMMKEILFNNILPFWDKAVDRTNGGFYGKIDNHGTPDPLAPKGLVQHARFLWSYSALYRQFREEWFRERAQHAKEFLLNSFYNRETGGWNYLVDYRGQSIDNRNHIYALSFVVYGFSEYATAFDERESYQVSLKTYELIERIARDRQYGGYHECFSSDFKKIEQIPEYGTVGFNKTMNTHIHLLEAYTTLTEASHSAAVKKSLCHLIDLILDKILDKKRRTLHLFFTPDWTPLPSPISFGHDIELSWLLVEAAEAANYRLAEAENACLSLAKNTLNGLDLEKGGLFYEGDRQMLSDKDEILRFAQDDRVAQNDRTTKVWWVQAEGLVGFLNAYQLSGDPRFLSAFESTKQWIMSHQMDHAHGEWFDKIFPDGSCGTEKGSVWKTLYHNSRACMKIMALEHVR
ncbi:MAG: AGE family epimerase/isomerase [Deltaproteobacteria bacterium]|nr:AGE family epimerase/isomerase [Deltaproteobacteria bacterium]